jgi:chromosome segregation ATPase
MALAIMTELLWIALGLVIGALAGYLYPRPQKKRVLRDSDETAALRGQVGKLHADMDGARLELARAKNVQDELEQQLKEVRARVPKLEGFERTNADLRLQLQGFDAVKQKLDTATAQLQAARPRLEDYDALHARLEASQTELSALKTKTAGFETLQTRAAKTEELEAKLAALEVEKSKLLKESNDAALKASDAETAQRKIRQALDESIAEVARTRDGMRQFETLKARIDDLETRGVSPETQARLEQLERDLEAAKTRADALEGSASAKLELQQAQLRLLDLERQVAAIPVIKDELHQRNAELTAARDRVAQLDAALNRVQELEAALASREAELERLKTPSQAESV